MKLKILSWSKSKIAACFFMFSSRKFKFLGISLYHAIQKGNQGAGKNRAHISAYCLKQTLYIKGFVRRGTHLFAQDFTPLPGFLFVLHGIEKNNKTCCYFWIYFITEFDPVCVLIFLLLGCSVVMVLWLEPNKKSSGTFCWIFLYRTLEKGNQHGGH